MGKRKKQPMDVLTGLLAELLKHGPAYDTNAEIIVDEKFDTGQLQQLIKVFPEFKEGYEDALGALQCALQNREDRLTAIEYAETMRTPAIRQSISFKKFLKWYERYHRVEPAQCARVLDAMVPGDETPEQKLAMVRIAAQEEEEEAKAKSAKAGK